MSRFSEEDLSKWLCCALKGDQVAYGQFLDAISRIARGFLFNKGIRANESEDIVQEILLSVHKAKHTFVPNAPVLPWLFAIIQYRLVDYFRSNGRNPSVLSEVLPEDELNSSYEPPHEDRLLAEQLLALLPERERRILRYLKMEGWSVKEISEQIGISESAVKVYAFRAIRSLRARLGGATDEN